MHAKALRALIPIKFVLGDNAPIELASLIKTAPRVRSVFNKSASNQPVRRRKIASKESFVVQGNVSKMTAKENNALPNNYVGQATASTLVPECSANRENDALMVNVLQILVVEFPVRPMKFVSTESAERISARESLTPVAMAASAESTNVSMTLAAAQSVHKD